VRRLVAAGALSAAASATARAQAPGRTFDMVAYLAPINDSVAVAAGLPPLRTAPLAPGDREVRLWVDYGIGVPHHLVRLQFAGATPPAGTLVAHYPIDHPAVAAGVRRTLDGRCTAVRGRWATETCVARFVRPVSWPEVARRLDSLGVWTLPGESVLPRRDFVVTDGVGLYVETRAGAAYRAYAYGNPESWDLPEPRRAAAVIDLVHTAVSRVRSCAEVSKEWCR
jgi:hypothetical protein